MKNKILFWIVHIILLLICIGSALAVDIVVNDTAESQDAGNWTGGSVTTSSTEAYAGTYSIKTTGAQSDPAFHNDGSDYPNVNITLKAWVWSGAGYYGGLGYAQDVSNYYYVGFSGSTSIQVRSKTGGTWQDLETNASCAAISVDTFYNFEMNISSNGGSDDIELIITDSGGAYKCTYATTFNEAWADSTSQNGIMLRHGIGGTPAYYWDDISLIENPEDVGGGADVTDPVIENVTNSSITNISATIAWDTDEFSNSSVNYGLSQALGSWSRSNDNVTSHSRGLTSLIDNSTYYFNVTSCDNSGNCATDGAYTFDTLENSTPPVISGLIFNSFDPANYFRSNTSNINLSVAVLDQQGGASNVTFYLRETGNFTVVGMPDTQNSVKYNTTLWDNETQALYNMINEYNVKSVFHVADMINDPETAQQWIDFNSSMAKVMGAAPFMSAVGNHELVPDSDLTHYHEYYNWTTFDTTNRGHEGNNNENHYYIFNHTPSIQMGIITLTYNPSANQIKWVNETIQNLSHIIWIFVSHDIIKGSGALSTAGGEYGQQTWDQILKHHDNILFTDNGHWVDAEESNYSKQNLNGSYIDMVFTNYQQSYATDTAYVLYTFDTANNQIHKRTYFPFNNTFGSGSAQDFKISYTMTEPAYSPICNNTLVSNASTTYCEITGLNETFYEWYVYGQSPTSSNTSAAYSFSYIDNSTPPPPATYIWLLDGNGSDNFTTAVNGEQDFWYEIYNHTTGISLNMSSSNATYADSNYLFTTSTTGDGNPKFADRNDYDRFTVENFLFSVPKENESAVIRFIAPENRTYTINSNFTTTWASPGGNFTVGLYKNALNGTNYFLANLSGVNQSYSYTTSLNLYVGESMIFRINPNGDASNDIVGTFINISGGVSVDPISLNSVLFSIYDADTFAYILQNVNITMEDNQTYFFNTSNGTTTATGILDGTYTTTIASVDYSDTQIFVTGSNHSFQTQDIYLVADADADPVTFFVQNNLGENIENATATFTTDINGTPVVVSQQVTDFAGIFQVELDSDRWYAITVTHAEYETWTGNVKPSQTQYTINMDNLGGTSFVSIYEDIYHSTTMSHEPNSTDAEFNLSILSNIGSLEFYGLMYNGTVLTNQTASTGGGVETVNVSSLTPWDDVLTITYWFKSTNQSDLTTWDQNWLISDQIPTNATFVGGLFDGIETADPGIKVLLGMGIIMALLVLGGLLTATLVGASIAGMAGLGVAAFAGLFPLPITIVALVILGTMLVADSLGGAR